jgi:hypothetical protein
MTPGPNFSRFLPVPRRCDSIDSELKILPTQSCILKDCDCKSP